MGRKFVVLYMDRTAPGTPDALGSVFDRIVEDGLLHNLFVDNPIRTRDRFIEEMLVPGTLPLVVTCEDDMAGFSWFNRIQGKSASSHFVVFRRFWGRKTRIPLVRRFSRYMLSLRDGDGHLFDCLYGVTPGNNPLAWKVGIQSGWRMIGTIPNRIFLADEGKSVDGVVTAVTREILGMTGEESVEAVWDA